MYGVFALAHYNAACVHAVLSTGRAGPKATPTPINDTEAAKLRDLALAQLEAALRLGWRDAAHARADADLEPLREDPRFNDLLQRMAPPTSREE